MSDDLFSRLFELFNQPGPVNMRLAAEVARHLAGERQAVDPWAAEEYRELTRLAEFRLEQVAPFPVSPAPEVLPVDGREWAERNLEGFRYLAEPFGGMVDLESAGPAAGLLGQLGPAMVGMQVGSLVGSLAGWVMAGFDAGVPVEGEGPVTYVVPTIERFILTHGFEARDVRLWVALNETAHRAIFRVPWSIEHLAELARRYASTLRIDPQNLMEMMQGVDPTDPAGGVDPEAIAGMLDSPESRQTQAELRAFLGLTNGYRRLLVERAGGDLLPGLARMDEARDSERELDESAAGSALTATFVDSETIAVGRSFCEEVERRYGADELAAMWTAEGRFPTANELADPVQWAARVLLEGFEL